jgi:hypothetical protein
VHRLYEALQNPHAANRMWLAQFVCAPQFCKAASGLCGHTVHWHKISNLFIMVTLVLIQLFVICDDEYINKNSEKF